MTSKTEYISSHIKDATEIAIISLIKATVFTVGSVLIVASGVADWIIIQTIPYAIAPAIAFAYMAKKWYSSMIHRIELGLVAGFALGLIMRGIGCFVVILVDTFGFQNTITIIGLEVISLSIWMYNDLNTWVTTEIERQEEIANRQEEENKIKTEKTE